VCTAHTLRELRVCQRPTPCTPLLCPSRASSRMLQLLQPMVQRTYFYTLLKPMVQSTHLQPIALPHSLARFRIKLLCDIPFSNLKETVPVENSQKSALQVFSTVHRVASRILRILTCKAPGPCMKVSWLPAINGWRNVAGVVKDGVEN